MTSLQTKASRGSVVSMFRPKHLGTVSQLCGSLEILGKYIQSGDVDKDVICREVVEDIALGQAAKVQVAREGHGETGKHRDAGGVVCDFCKTVHGRLL